MKTMHSDKNNALRNKKSVDPSRCHCGVGGSFAECCQVVHNQLASAETAEALMRARYSAFVVGNIEFLKESLIESKRGDFDDQEAKAWSVQSKWQGLDIVSTINGDAGDDRGVVEFKAHYQADDKMQIHHEKSRFEKVDGCWFYKDGELVATAKSPGRNSPCICGSGKKFKKCCWGKND